MARRGRFNVREFLAGTGAGGSLVASAVVSFLAVTAFVAFDEVPFGTGTGDEESISLDGGGSAALTGGFGGGGAAGAVVFGPATAAADVGGPGNPGTPGAGGGPGPDPGAPPAGVPPGAPAPPAPGVPPGAPAPGAPNPIDQAVAGIDMTVEGATGVDPNLGGATQPITGTVDQAVQGLTGDDVGGHLGDLPGGSGP